MRGEEEVKGAGASRYGKRMKVLIIKNWQPEALSQASGKRDGRGVCGAVRRKEGAVGFHRQQAKTSQTHLREGMKDQKAWLSPQEHAGRP